MPIGELNCPSPVPFVPHLLMNTGGEGEGVGFGEGGAVGFGEGDDTGGTSVTLSEGGEVFR